MDVNEVIGVVAITGGVLAVVVVLATRRRVQRRLFRGTGLEEWRRNADRLSWRDRWELMRANSAGRATEPRLARLAIQRAEVRIAATEREMRWSVTRWLYILVAGLAMVSIAVHVVPSMGNGQAPLDWTLVGLHLTLVIIFVPLALFWNRLVRWDQRLCRRSIAENAALLKDPPEIDSRNE